MNNRKCSGCGLVNFASASACKRCGSPLETVFASADAEASAVPAFGPEDADTNGERRGRRSLLRRTLTVLGVTFTLLVGCHASLLLTSTPVTYDERQQVARAVELIEQSGFTRETFLLRRLANFRTTDNWFNSYTGHPNAFASTNFPFEIVTLYPDFFRYPVDDVERAVILLHEARHLAGDDEEEACASVWRDKGRLGWTQEKYGRSRVWRNVAELSRRYAPKLFNCGEDGRQDCYE